MKECQMNEASRGDHTVGVCFHEVPRASAKRRKQEGVVRGCCVDSGNRMGRVLVLQDGQFWRQPYNDANAPCTKMWHTLKNGQEGTFYVISVLPLIIKTESPGERAPGGVEGDTGLWNGCLT